MLAAVPTCLALLAVISSHTRLLQAAPFPAIENAVFTSYDLQAEESAPALSQVHAQHNRHRRHDGDGNYHGHSHHKRHWDHHFPRQGGFGFEHPPYHRPPHHRFESFPHGFEPFPNTFEPPEYEEHQRPFKAELEPFKDEKKSGPKPPSTTSVAPLPAPSSIPDTSTTTAASTSTSTTAATTTVPTSSSSSTEDATLAIDIRIG
ncbi:uncharacterized protein Dana_GF18615 [Drosophila ananassae]|uniref:Uncharacterized protein n=1 Tax=Drosophila ananassae TaxID=7217 RepID=B3LVR8_DROAN|nr:uncharacterized protein LOC6501386 [Drosophila ananassae]EDV43692.1 uncharacterized protein Dana_GF18615 [Drosophila ananassae]